MIEFGNEISYARTCWLGRLAQLVEQDVYTIEVRGSSPLSPTRKCTRKGVFCCGEESATFARGVEAVIPYF